MAKEIKYYYRHTKNSKNDASLIRWSENSMIYLDEDVDFKQHLEVNIYKFTNNKMIKPKRSDYYELKPIMNEIFYDHYNLAINMIFKELNSDGEFYIARNERSWIEVDCFTEGKRHINITFQDSIESLYFEVYSSHGIRRRSICRKNGTVIAKEQFGVILRLTINLLQDPDSFNVLIDSFLKDFYSLAQDEQDVTNLIITTGQSFKAVVEQLDIRKRNLEKRLIETDNDSELDRTRMRGEIDGINYALKTLAINQ